jgi:O-acetyl-ADP-ribose deacetylase (regulator of RNase III)
VKKTGQGFNNHRGNVPMPIEFVSGDLFANHFTAQALAHGCNCEGSMGAGIATGFRDRYPAMFAEYRLRCKAKPREFNLGDAFLWKADRLPWVFNLGTQEGVWRARASYEAIEAALESMRRQADAEGISRMAIPRIGVGYGGLSWRKVRAIVEKVFAGWSGTLHVYEEFVPEGGQAIVARQENPAVQIVVESRRKKRTTIEKAWPGALVLDVTSKGEEPWVRFSPFFPHGGIPVPGSTSVFGRSVEGIWQGLKVFETEDIDPSRWEVADMRGIKRGGRTRGKVLGHRFGVGGSVLLSYRDARYNIYLPAYRWILENRLAAEVGRLREETAAKTVVLLDYETNGDVEDLARPLSHAALVKLYLEGCWPATKAGGNREGEGGAER